MLVGKCAQVKTGLLRLLSCQSANAEFLLERMKKNSGAVNVAV